MLRSASKVKLWLYCWWLIYRETFTFKGIILAFWGWLRPYFTPRMIPIVLSIWVFTNGVWYILAFAPIELPIAIRAFAKSYIAFLYTPLGFEKPIILLVARWIYKAIYGLRFTPIYKVKLLKRLNYERYGLSRRGWGYVQ